MSMILYNVRHRGYYEYEKFILNTFQFSNEINRLLKEVHDTSEKSFENKFKKLDAVVDNLSEINSPAYKILFMRLAKMR